MSNTRQKTQNIAVIGLFVAVIIVLQMISCFVQIGTFPLNLVMVPIILAACMYGYKMGAIMGLVFGMVVYLCCAVGLDKGGAMVFAANPLICAVIVLGKGAASGFIAGLVAKPLMKKGKNLLAVILAGITAPIVNTGLFIIGMLVFYQDILAVWSGGTDMLYYIIFTLTGINFILELVLNLVMSTGISRVMKAVKRI